ncbi:hypothetical protein Q9233_009707 [Columba guinea]|nr:hypothetical protein Q9233_009707 [Columba guinea]
MWRSLSRPWHWVGFDNWRHRRLLQSVFTVLPAGPAELSLRVFCNSQKVNLNRMTENRLQHHPLGMTQSLSQVHDQTGHRPPHAAGLCRSAGAGECPPWPGTQCWMRPAAGTSSALPPPAPHRPRGRAQRCLPPLPTGRGDELSAASPRSPQAAAPPCRGSGARARGGAGPEREGGPRAAPAPSRLGLARRSAAPRAGGESVWRAMALGSAWKQMSWLYYQYLLVTALYMLEPWERTVFNSMLVSIVGMALYTGYVFMPQHIMAILHYFEIVQ